MTMADEKRLGIIDAWRKLYNDGFYYNYETIRLWINQKYARPWISASEFDWLKMKATLSAASNSNLSQNAREKALVIELIKLMPASATGKKTITGRQLIDLAVLHGAASRSALYRRNVTANRIMSEEEAILAISGETLSEEPIQKPGRRVRRVYNAATA